jgi:flagellar basal body-associated protein FliL
MDKLETHSNVDQSTFEELKNDIIERINSFEKYIQFISNVFFYIFIF